MPAPSSAVFVNVGPDAYHWQHTTTMYVSPKAEAQAREKAGLRPRGWVFAIVALRGPKEAREVIAASDPLTRAKAEAFCTSVNLRMKTSTR